jgi:TolB-like protein/class 3 adenylate cyclase/Tfp pilus assembly protein PilF
MERRLAAILAADVVGYSRLMEQDEAWTMSALKARRHDILNPLVARHHGRIVKLMGDGVLVEFASAVNAVGCAVELQKKMAEASAGETDDRRIALRIGINLGDVIVEGGDLYGDGVIIAARLQALAEPGDIWIAASVHDQIEKKLALNFEDLGLREIKNMARPVHIYRIVGDTLPAQIMSGAPAKPSIAVLPFVNMSGDPEQQYFSDGITEDIITELLRFRSLFVIARNSSFQYRDKSIDVRRVGRELSVQYVVEGSVRKAGNSVRITAQLVDAATGNHLWAERYDRTLDDIFAVQDEVVHKIAARLEGRLATKVAELARRKPTQSMAAYECVLQAREHLGTFDWSAAEPLLRQAIKLDPGYAQAYAWLAKSIVYRFFFDLRSELLDEALDYAQRGVGLDESDAVCHVALAQTYLFQRQFERAGVHYDRALALNPADVLTLAHRCRWLSSMGRQQEALAGLDEVLLREPFPPSWYWEARSIALLAARRYRDAIDAIGRMSRLHYYNHAYLAACHAQLGQLEEAKAEVAEVLRLRPDYTITRTMLSEPFKNPADAEPEVESLRKAGLPE